MRASHSPDDFRGNFQVFSRFFLKRIRVFTETAFFASSAMFFCSSKKRVYDEKSISHLESNGAIKAESENHMTEKSFRNGLSKVLRRFSFALLEKSKEFE